MIALLLAVFSQPALARTLVEDPPQALPSPAAPPAPAGPDRSAPPAVRSAAPLPLPSPELHALWDGLNVAHVQVEGLRKVQVAVMLHRGSVALCGAPAPACGALADLLGVATESTDPSALEEKLTLLDAELYGSMSLRDTTVSLAVPPERLDEGLALLREALLTPAFPKDELKLHKRDTLLNYRSIWPTDPGMIARLARDYAWFPADVAYGRRPDLEGWEALSPADLQEVHAKLLGEAPATVLVVSGAPWSELEGRLRQTLAGVGKPGERPAPLPFTPPAKGRVVAVDVPGQVQVSVRLRVPAPAASSADRPGFQASHFALGGTFMSRLNENLREEKGWTYGAYGRYFPAPAYGIWDFGVDVAAENTAEAVGEIMAELKELQEGGLSADELAAAGTDQVQTWNQRLATSDSAKGWYYALLEQGDSVEGSRARLEAVQALDVETAKRASAASLDPAGPRLWVLVGDRSRLQPELEALGWTAEWYTAQQAVAGELP